MPKYKITVEEEGGIYFNWEMFFYAVILSIGAAIFAAITK
jgi:hypothetical protein